MSASFEFSFERNLSPLAWLGIGTGIATLIGAYVYVLLKDDEHLAPDSLHTRPRFGGFASSAVDELRAALDANNDAVRRLWAAEAELKPISDRFWAMDPIAAEALLPEIWAHQKRIKAIQDDVDATRRKMREWSQVVSLQRKPAQTEAGRRADELLRELDDITNPRGN